MPLFLVILILLVVGFILWFVETQSFIPLDPTIKKIIQVVVVIAVLLWLADVFNLWQYINAIKVGGH